MYDENKNIVINSKAVVNVKKITQFFTDEKIYMVAYYRYLRLDESSDLTSFVIKSEYNPFWWINSMIEKIIKDEEYVDEVVNIIYL